MRIQIPLSKIVQKVQNDSEEAGQHVRDYHNHKFAKEVKKAIAAKLYLGLYEKRFGPVDLKDHRTPDLKDHRVYETQKVIETYRSNMRQAPVTQQLGNENKDSVR
jgi:hypothetical protein